MDLSIVIPVKNEQENILPLLSEIHAVLEGRYDYEVIYVDDGSSDATVRVLEEGRTHYPRLRVLCHAHSYGQSTAVRSGVQAARAAWIVTLDGDGQNDPADIPKFMAVVEAPDCPPDLKLIAGWRKKRRDSWLKRISSKIANTVRSVLLRDNTPDTGCGLKLFQRELYLELPYFDHMHRFLPALVQRAGYQVRSIEVHHRHRERGVSKYGLHNRLWVGIVDLLGVSWLQRRAQRPSIMEVE
ncbi:MAG: dolichol-phosphate mannosyltransferase [Halothiobacillaceae bacterium]|nr:MAG: dolichol-phosphate mannosyltransferase [Halothiobacillaceae bacterium]